MAAADQAPLSPDALYLAPPAADRFVHSLSLWCPPRNGDRVPGRAVNDCIATMPYWAISTSELAVN
eukprot:CAMPEP_0181248992 /NCGR_PEP_ID=MMETSP1096-20121128/45492_1 /TAXON_ID=156174 ORGANISM="Chrysochromulina ericina, Strain CCMP281" /NCGR_SAMPLE_ID=MMETSP1096 /ASSEMBLY_ACC=CAM_ASM_000453 /LENGTH=65 /DNA_ID=CAMNT_0023346251 /DNA_START=591 /DNA_END=788 /DNA_ORIENTATION=+